MKDCGAVQQECHLRLYNLKKKSTETVDVSDKNCQKLNSLTRDWIAWSKDMGLEGPEVQS